MTKYLDSLGPFLLEDAAATAALREGGGGGGISPLYEEMFALCKKWPDEFMNGIGGWVPNGPNETSASDVYLHLWNDFIAAGAALGTFDLDIRIPPSGHWAVFSELYCELRDTLHMDLNSTTMDTLTSPQPSLQFKVPPSADSNTSFAPIRPVSASHKRPFSIDLSLELERQLVMESLPPTPAHNATSHANSAPVIAHLRDSLDPNVLAHIILQLRRSLSNLSKEK
ncbi:hypothetical protein F5880DRAFT_1642781 [Lentinula raphanica]|nr:hypothetical protein F5880DRAFT_1642781 [Lentinula raphanica]